MASIVRLPPSSIFLAAPKNLFGLCNAAGSKPPDNVLPDDGITKLYALASLVILSSNITTSFFCSTSLFALSKTISATFTWCSGISSNVEYITSPLIERFISVTSSGLSSIKRTISSTSGWLVVMLFASFLRSVVLPTFGGATIIPLWPKPIGAIKSIILVEYSVGTVSRRILLFGYIGVKSSKLFLFSDTSGKSPFIVLTYINAENFSVSFGVLAIPWTLSPVASLNLFIWIGDTYISFGVDK